MDREVAWSPEALDDVEAIAEYIERNSAFYAQAVATAILEMARSIGRFPWMGRVVPEMGSQNIGERFVYSYRVTYELQEGRILIVAVIHGKRLIENISDRLAGSNE